ncbi:DUF2147 domain-containing protein [Polynucleobacter sp. AP-Feld-500C-C5]|uniref:DUF2147 domain-containing protein n=1 Tax=Polynucleobacter sp. AP-Feld-500C-C5 TaxID=2576924 RepID=UPI001C0B518E|nr:DUF2147 domain-containing protein [Polynucleobacter sp. AP-Feld-500C-C5]MBU3632076.1 DUF2147 domain-containing protein [Polynucleobacter sp. AP-Feld-500C-C5]
MKKPLFFLFAASILCLGVNVISSQTTDSIAGSWKTFDDDTNQPAAIVLITEKNGLFSGVVTKLLDPSALPTCEKCIDYRKGKAVIGMEILSGLKKTGDSYSGGHILDPDDGEIYRAEMKLKDQGTKLDLRAYIGIPLLGRTQTWIRER